MQKSNADRKSTWEVDNVWSQFFQAAEEARLSHYQKKRGHTSKRH